jgi:hypothetical protein
MGGFAAGLASVGGSLAQAQELQRKEKIEQIKLALEQGRLGVEQKYADTASKRLSMEDQREAQLQKLRDAQIAEIMKRVNQSPPMVQKLKDAESALGRPLKEEEKLAALGIRPPIIHQSEYDKTVDRMRAEAEMYKKYPHLAKILHPGRSASASSGSGSSVEDKAKDVQSGSAKLTDFPQKERAAISTYLRQHNMKAGSGNLRPLNTTEQRLIDNINTMEPMIGSLEKVIMDAHLERDNSPIAPRRAWWEYRYLNIAPDDPVRGELIRNSAALQVMGAAPWIQIGRGKYLFEAISNHLPNTEDSPKLLMDKLKFLHGVIENSKKSLGVTEEDTRPGGNADQPKGPVDIDKALDGIFGATSGGPRNNQ